MCHDVANDPLFALEAEAPFAVPALDVVIVVIPFQVLLLAGGTGDPVVGKVWIYFQTCLNAKGSLRRNLETHKT